MSKENEAHRNWRVADSEINTDWHAVGYTYDGTEGKHQGVFVPVHHWAGRIEADTMVVALLGGATRADARQAAIEA